MRALLAAALLAATPPQDAPDAAAIAATIPDGDGEALRRWAANRLDAIGEACGCIDLANIGRGYDTPDGAVEATDSLGFQRGVEAKRMVILTAHADRDGIALLLELARLLSKRKFRATIVYALLPAGDRAAWGDRLLAETAATHGWTVAALLYNDAGAGGPPEGKAKALADMLANGDFDGRLSAAPEAFRALDAPALRIAIGGAALDAVVRAERSAAQRLAGAR